MKTYVKLYTIYTEDGGYWVDPESPFLTTSKIYAEAVLNLYRQHVEGELKDARIVELSIEQRVFDGTDDRLNGDQK